MTTLQVHLLMLGLGLLAFLLLAGVYSKRSPVHHRSGKPWVSILAGFVVAVSPFSRFWRDPFNGIDLLTQSLLVSAIALLALLLIALLRSSIKGMRKARYRREHIPKAQPTNKGSGGLTPISINADSTDDVTPEIAVNQFASTPETDKEITPTRIYDAQTYHDPLRNQPQTLASDALPTKAYRDETKQLDKTISDSNAANDQSTAVNADDDPLVSPINHSLLAEEELNSPSLPVDEDKLDLSDTEQLFAEIRSQRTEVELPDDKELQDATQRATREELDLDTSVINENVISQKSVVTEDKSGSKVELSAIEEAEVLDADESNLEFGNDLTGEYAHPGPSTRPMHFIDNTTAEEVHVPETLADAMIAVKVSAVSVQAQVSSLEDSISQLDGIRDEQTKQAVATLKDHKQLLEKKEALISSEDEARRAAESVIAAQSATLAQAKRQQALADSLLAQERQRLKLMQEEVERSRKMARSAALLARKAAVAQQEIRNVAKREQTARLKSQESTRKAVTIARNAISALAAEERKRGLTRH